MIEELLFFTLHILQTSRIKDRNCFQLINFVFFKKLKLKCGTSLFDHVKYIKLPHLKYNDVYEIKFTLGYQIEAISLRDKCNI